MLHINLYGKILPRYVVIRWIFAPKIQNFKHWKMRLFGDIFNHNNILNFIVDFKIPGLSSSAFWVIFITETIFWKIWLALIYRDEVEKDDCWQMTPYLHSLLPIRRLSLFISNIFSHIWTRHDWHASCQKCRWGGWQDGRHVMNTRGGLGPGPSPARTIFSSFFEAWSLPDPSLKLQSPKGLKLENIRPDPPLMNTWKTHRIFEVLRENWFYKHNKTIFFLLP